MNDILARMRAVVTANAYSLVVCAVTLITVIASMWVAIPARRERAQLAAENNKLEALIRSAGLWVTQFQPASNEESAVWQTTASELAALGVKPSERLTIAQIVARRAEDAGYVGAHIKFVAPGAGTSLPARQVAGVSFNPAPYALQITGSGNLTTLSTFVGSLPPAVELQAISLTGTADGGANTSITLSVFEPAGGNVK
jgi:hypothetical protein